MKKNIVKMVVLGLSFYFSATLLSAEKAESGKKGKWREYFFSDSERKVKTAEKTNRTETNPEGMIDLIDSQTTNVVDYGSFRLNFRLYSRGGVISHLSFGVFRRLNIGVSWDNEELIGATNPTTNAPTLNMKFRVYDGGQILPSFAIGYDGQGRFFDKNKDEYQEKERGFFLVLGREIFFPGLEAAAGMNIARFKEGIVLGSVALSYTLERRLTLLTEWDNIREIPESRFNAGFRVFPIPSLGIDFAVRRIGSDKEKERILRINYVGRF